MNNIYFHKQSLTQINLNSQTNQLSNYLIKQKIGEGSFSKVKLAINKITNEKVAIKIISKNKLMKTDKIRIEREIKILKSISHQNIIKFKSAFEDSHFYFLVMEYCDYKELFHYIIKHKKIEKEKASIIFYQLINALNYLHNNKICHRDLKPENILINEQNLKIKIIDFGLSNYFKPENNFILNSACGSPSYAAPEMIKNKPYNAKKVDVWSLGITLYVMLCGHLPFEDKNSLKLFKKILNFKLDYNGEDMDEISKNLLDKMLCKDFEKRIDIKDIINHPFYIMGKRLYEKFLYKKNILTENNNKIIFRSCKNILNIHKNKEKKNRVITDNLNLNNKIRNYLTQENNSLLHNTYNINNKSINNTNSSNSSIENIKSNRLSMKNIKYFKDYINYNNINKNKNLIKLNSKENISIKVKKKIFNNKLKSYNNDLNNKINKIEKNNKIINNRIIINKYSNNNTPLKHKKLISFNKTENGKEKSTISFSTIDKNENNNNNFIYYKKNNNNFENKIDLNIKNKNINKENNSKKKYIKISKNNKLIKLNQNAIQKFCIKFKLNINNYNNTDSNFYINCINSFNNNNNKIYKYNNRNFNKILNNNINKTKSNNNINNIECLSKKMIKISSKINAFKKLHN